MVTIGQHADLKIVKTLSFGAYLAAGDREILLPIREVPKEAAVGDTLRVFIYKDSENRLIASTREPYIQVNRFAYLRVMDTTKYGAFLDWGMDNQLLVPFREQHVPLVKGRSYVVRMYVDKKTDRLVATSRIEKNLANEAGPDIKQSEKVDLLVYGQTEIAYKVIINQKYSGMLYKNEIYKPVSYGQNLTGYVKKIREDRRIDVTLRMPGADEYERAKQVLLEQLREHGGFLPLHDDSSPDEIKKLLHMSKKAFKKTIGALYKERKIVLEPDGIRLAS